MSASRPAPRAIALAWLRGIVAWEVEQTDRPTSLTLASTRSVALEMMLSADADGGNCYPGQRHLVRVCGVRANTVSALRHRWVRHGWLRDTGRRVFGGTFVYQLAIPEGIGEANAEANGKQTLRSPEGSETPCNALPGVSCVTGQGDRPGTSLGGRPETSPHQGDRPGDRPGDVPGTSNQMTSGPEIRERERDSCGAGAPPLPVNGPLRGLQQQGSEGHEAHSHDPQQGMEVVGVGDGATRLAQRHEAQRLAKAAKLVQVAWNDVAPDYCTLAEFDYVLQGLRRTEDPDVTADGVVEALQHSDAEFRDQESLWAWWANYTGEWLGSDGDVRFAGGL